MLETDELWPDAVLSSADHPPLLTALFRDLTDPWDLLARLDETVNTIEDERQGTIHPTAVIEGDVWLAPDATVGPAAFIQGPAWIGSGASIGHGAYLRGGVILGPGVIVGHSSELKRTIALAGAKLPHFNYAGDSVLGRDVNLGAGVKIANFNAFGNGVRVAGGSGRVLRKAGALLGDRVSIGCNAVLAPGTVVGARTVIYDGANVRGAVPADRIVKLRTTLETVERR